MDEKNKRMEFYGGALGPWIPVIFMIAFIIFSVAKGGGGFTTFSVILFGALIIGFLLAKDKKGFGSIAFSSFKNDLLGIMIVAFLFAGILGDLLSQSGLIDSMIWVISEFDISVGWIPVVTFLICVLISTSCGTSAGTATTVAPIMIPLAAQLDINIGLVGGAVIAGSIFGDNLAPISDTTIASALTQEAEVKDVVRTRLPYSLIAGGISAVLFIILGMNMEGSAHLEFAAEDVNPNSLVLLCLPILMIILMKIGLDLVGTLLICNMVGIILNIVLGCIPLNVMVSNEGPIGAGLNGMMGLVLFIILLFMILEILNVSGAFEKIMNALISHCKTPRSGELICMLLISVSTIAAGGSSPAIIFCGPMIKKVMTSFGIERTRGSNILDATSCGVSGLLPYGTCMMLCLTAAQGCTDADFTFMDILPYSFHSMFLILVFVLSTLTGIGRRFEDGGQKK